jgi:hypothetical protein
MCKYCEGDNLKRINLMTDKKFNPVCIWDNKLFIDDGEGDTEMEINYCPMCGRKL